MRIHWFNYGIHRPDGINWEWIDGGSVPTSGVQFIDGYPRNSHDDSLAFVSYKGRNDDLLTRACPSTVCTGYALCEYDCMPQGTVLLRT